MKANNKEKMRHLYEDWLSCNMSKALFCRQHKIHYTTFYYWVKKFQAEETSAPASFQDKGFSRISITEPASSAQVLQPAAVLIFPSGARLEFFSPLEASFLKSLLS
jgi:transposase-like protein